MHVDVCIVCQAQTAYQKSYKQETCHTGGIALSPVLKLKLNPAIHNACSREPLCRMCTGALYLVACTRRKPVIVAVAQNESSLALVQPAAHSTTPVLYLPPPQALAYVYTYTVWNIRGSQKEPLISIPPLCPHFVINNLPFASFFYEKKYVVVRQHDVGVIVFLAAHT